MDKVKESFLKNEFLTMSLFGALGRSSTYSKSASENDKRDFRYALREKLHEIGSRYSLTVTEEKHLANIVELADSLTSRFSYCLKNRRFRIGIAQKALNLYLKYLWCADLISEPPHCPFDSIIIGYLPDCGDLNWTEIDNVGDYLRLVRAAKTTAQNRSLSEWELQIWGKSPQNKANQKITTAKRNKIKSPGWEKFASKFHDKFKKIMAPYRNNVLETASIRRIVEKVPEFKDQEQWIYPSDHCKNHTNKGACRCALTKNAIFERIGRGKYRVL